MNQQRELCQWCEEHGLEVIATTEYAGVHVCDYCRRGEWNPARPRELAIPCKVPGCPVLLDKAGRDRLCYTHRNTVPETATEARKGSAAPPRRCPTEGCEKFLTKQNKTGVCENCRKARAHAKFNEKAAARAVAKLEKLQAKQQLKKERTTMTKNTEASPDLRHCNQCGCKLRYNNGQETCSKYACRRAAAGKSVKPRGEGYAASGKKSAAKKPGRKPGRKPAAAPQPQAMVAQPVRSSSADQIFHVAVRGSNLDRIFASLPAERKVDLISQVLSAEV